MKLKTKNLKHTPTKLKAKNLFGSAIVAHTVWHKFSGWLIKTYGKDLHSDWKYMEGKDSKTGKIFKLKYRTFNDYELSQRLTGHEVISRIERYVERYIPEIQVVRCDDAVYAGSTLLLIPHPKHGITVMYLPQCTEIQNQFFLYRSHYNMLMKGLKNLKYVFKGAL